MAAAALEIDEWASTLAGHRPARGGSVPVTARS